MKSLSVCLRIIFVELFILGYGCLVVNITNAQSTLALHEKCAEEAKKFFYKSEKINPFVSPNRELGWWYDDGGWGTTEYITHYNKKLDKCFILIKSDYHYTWVSRSKNIRAKPEDFNRLTDMKVMFDVFEGRMVAVFDQWNGKFDLLSYGCWVENKKCRSQSEFEVLVKPYMEE